MARSSAPGAELVGRALPAQRGQHVELPGLQAVRGERGPAGPVQVPGQPGHPAEHLQRLEVQVGPLRLPAGDQLVDLVAERLRPLTWSMARQHIS